MEQPGHLERLISSPRFGAYVDECQGDRDQAVALYHWTGRLAGGFLEDFRHLEIIYRNVIDRSLQAHTDAMGTRAGTAWFDEPSWVRHHWWDRSAQRHVREAKQRAGRRRRGPAPQGAVVAELPFGFWRYVIAARYEESFWKPALDDAFRGIPGSTAEGRRVELEDQIIPLHKLRNRIAHHEPIFKPFHRKLPGNKMVSYSIEEHHEMLLTMLGWMDPVSGEWVRQESLVPGLLATRP